MDWLFKRGRSVDFAFCLCTIVDEYTWRERKIDIKLWFLFLLLIVDPTVLTLLHYFGLCYIVCTTCFTYPYENVFGFIISWTSDHRMPEKEYNSSLFIWFISCQFIIFLQTWQTSPASLPSLPWQTSPGRPPGLPWPPSPAALPWQTSPGTPWQTSPDRSPLQTSPGTP